MVENMKNAREIQKEKHAFFLSDDALRLLKRGKHGLERECLRVTENGDLSMKPHPATLGSALTNPFIKTDFSEAQIEYATKPYRSSGSALKQLTELCSFTAKEINELQWAFSMPARLPAEADIPLALYGNSQEGQKKTIYRRGLGYRYGRKMQTISGMHYNLSFSHDLLHYLQSEYYHDQNPSEQYLGTIRNFNRLSPILFYLFGASPAYDASFEAKIDSIQKLDKNTYFAPHATSLRLSDIGYTSRVQNSLDISLNSLEQYINDLCHAIRTTYPPFSQFNEAAENQLNDHYLQIENEYYALIRPKNTPRENEKLLDVLKNRGIIYLEIRCLDLDPFEAAGTDRNRLAFLELLLYYCLLLESPAASREEHLQWMDNQTHVVVEGRKPGCKIQYLGDTLPLKDFGRRILDDMESLAVQFDKVVESNLYSEALQLQREKFEDVEKTPSARILSELREKKMSFIDLGLELSENHARELNDYRLSKEIYQKYKSTALNSIEIQKEIENSENQFEPSKMAGVCNESMES